jgi:RNA polymerase sigma-70 factor (sigma-E family)
MSKPGAAEDIEAFFGRQYPGVTRLVLLLVGDRALAEEIAMDAFVVAYTGWRRISRLDHPEAYVRRAAVNIAVSRLRRRSAERRANARTAAAGEPPSVPAFDPSPGEDAREVVAAVSALPPRQRACVVLHYFEELSVAETAKALRCSDGTVKSQLSKARQTLGAALGYLGEPQGERV